METWHPDVRFFEIRDEAASCGAVLSRPLRPPEEARGRLDGRVHQPLSTDRCDQIPVAYLVCNFHPPVGDKPSLLTHDEVETLFHEFGHGLHHMLTKVDYPAVAGINGVPWDAVELPSQFLENWCWERESLDLISGHVDTGEPIPTSCTSACGRPRTSSPACRWCGSWNSPSSTSAPPRVRPGRRRAHLRDPGPGARPGGGDQAAGIQPLRPRLLPHLRRRLCGGLLQLQVGRGAVRGRLLPVRGTRRARREPDAPSARTSWSGAAPQRPWSCS